MIHCPIQVQCAPSILWDRVQQNAPAPGGHYAGHLPNSGVQKHSADALYANYGIHLRCVESATGRRLWQAIDKAGVVVAAHPRHDGCLFIATAIATGA